MLLATKFSNSHGVALTTKAPSKPNQVLVGHQGQSPPPDSFYQLGAIHYIFFFTEGGVFSFITHEVATTLSKLEGTAISDSIVGRCVWFRWLKH